jgi:hypothetical protein
VINGGFQNFLHAITGLPGGFGTTVVPVIDTHDGWKGPIWKRKRRKPDAELRKELEKQFYGVIEGVDFAELDDEEFFELFMLFSDE